MTGLHVLATNDDGVDAPGLDALVRALDDLPDVRVSVVAPATNQTGASGTVTTTEFGVLPARTASGRAATAVAGSPSDAVLFALRQLLGEPPALVVAGVNEGPNLADFVTMSGTVAAALAAARLGVPALAVSAGLAPEMDYAAPARFAASLVARFRDDARLRDGMLLPGVRRSGIVLNVNFPPMPARGVRVVPLGRIADVTGYVRRAEAEGRATWAPVIVAGDITRVHPTSTLDAPTTDLEAFNHGFVAVTPLVPDLTLAAALERFGFVEELNVRPVG
jgi:5'/3'-nucleotidase SurE